MPLLPACLVVLAWHSEASGRGLAPPNDVAARIDAIIDAALIADDRRPAPPVDDHSFVRRLSLDVRGTVPTPSEVVAFVHDGRADKRTRLIDTWLQSDEHAEYFATWWYRTLTDLSVSSLGVRGDDAARAVAGSSGARFQAWLVEQVRTNRAYDEWTRDLLTASGRTDENGAAGFLARYGGDPQRTASAVGRRFLGMRIGCAQCHDHMVEPWTQRDFRGVAAFFARTRSVRVPSTARADNESMKRHLALFHNVVRIEDFTPTARPDSPMMMQRAHLHDETPKAWKGPTFEVNTGPARRRAFAAWLTAPHNPYFARSAANRVWAAMLGRGFVDPVDGFGAFNAPSHPEALTLLAEDFAASGFDLRRLLRIVLRTRAYARATAPDAADPAPFEVAPVRALSVDQFARSFIRTIGLDDIEPGDRLSGRIRRETIARAFARVFDDDESADTQDFTRSIPEALYLLNDKELVRLLSTERRRSVEALLARHDSHDERIDQLFWAAYARPPTETERSTIRAMVRRGPVAEMYSDLLWAIVNSAEFGTNH